MTPFHPAWVTGKSPPKADDLELGLRLWEVEDSNRLGMLLGGMVRFDVSLFFAWKHTFCLGVGMFLFVCCIFFNGFRGD